ncbi:hypothetical protein ACTXMK_05225 [Psychrobacter celer]
MFKKITIDNDTIFDTMRQLIANPDQFENIEVVIGSVSVLEVKLFGDQFHNSLTPTIMKGLIELQKGIYRSYCFAQYGDTNLRQLSKEELSQLEFTVIISEGCTDILAAIEGVLKAAGDLMTNLTGKQKLLALGMILITIMGYFAMENVKEYMSDQEANRHELAIKRANDETMLAIQENTIKAVKVGADASKPNADEAKDLDETEAEIDAINDAEATTASINPEDKDDYIKVLKPIDDKDVEVIQAVVTKYPVAEKTATIMSDSVNSFIKATSQADKVRYNNAVEMTGVVANNIASQPRKTSEAVVLKEKFRVLNVDSNKTQYMQARLRPVNSSYPDFNATFTDSSIDKTKQKRLADALISYHPIHLSVEAKSLNGKLNNALIAQVGEVDSTINFKAAQDTTIDT